MYHTSASSRSIRVGNTIVRMIHTSNHRRLQFAGALRAGYDSMRATGLLSLSAPDFATLIADIRDAETSINALF